MWALVVLITPCTFYVTFFHRTETKRQQAENQWKKVAASATEIPSTPSIEGDQQGQSVTPSMKRTSLAQFEVPTPTNQEIQSIITY